MIVAPDGTMVAGPVYGHEETLIADCDLSAGLRAKYAFDWSATTAARSGFSEY